MTRALAPLAAGLLGLAGSLGATLFLYRAASMALDRVLEERLRGAGETAVGLLGAGQPSGEALRALMQANGLEGAYLVSPALEVLADATGPSGVRADLLRLDATRARLALSGQASVAFGYSVGELHVATAFFPVPGADGSIRSVLVLEAGQSFVGARQTLHRALWAGVALATLGALALALAAWRWSRAEEQRRLASAKAVRGDALARMAAMVAHEIRNPLGIIRGAVELTQARASDALSERDHEALKDILDEVERLRRLTDDFLHLAREPELSLTPIDLAGVAREAAVGLERSYPSVEVRLELPMLMVDADPGRLRQVFANLLTNAAQAGARSIALKSESADGFARVEVRDDGVGIDHAVRAQLFDPFVSARQGGTGLGLAISRRLVERHGGTLTLMAGDGPGAAFELRLPLSSRK
ncbi:MAG: HAMP domain-containing histidine kinase [Deltaproteobacteria bacterium]|nr:HAMP domain-containing histidine kinase [Deltaproteobacteria bacterium]